jgi:D-alanyl-D-alanine carboxypeptidase (penicillin-binding protein 5/6)
VWRADNLVLETPLHAAEAVAKGGITGRAIEAATEFVIGLFLSRGKKI